MRKGNVEETGGIETFGVEVSKSVILPGAHSAGANSWLGPG